MLETRCYAPPVQMTPRSHEGAKSATPLPHSTASKNHRPHSTMSVADNHSTSSIEIEIEGSSEAHLWDVQEILAERTAISGEKELLVVWKTSWIPAKNMIADGPVMRRFSEAAKCKFSSAYGPMCITLPVEPGTALAHDCATVVAAARRAAQREMTAVHSGTKRHALGDAKAKAPTRSNTQNK